MLRDDLNPKVRATNLAGERDVAADIALVRRRLAELDHEREQLTRQLETLEQDLPPYCGPSEPEIFVDAPITNHSSSAAKVALFLRLFAGRPDVFPLRWENRKTGRSGYSPACENEWVREICGKPKIKCGGCPHKAFIPPSEVIAEKHLRGSDGRSGDFVAGSVPGGGV